MAHAAGTVASRNRNTPGQTVSKGIDDQPNRTASSPATDGTTNTISEYSTVKSLSKGFASACNRERAAMTSGFFQLTRIEVTAMPSTLTARQIHPRNQSSRPAQANSKADHPAVK